MKRWIGLAVMGTAVLHTVVGLIFATQPLLDVLNAGVFNAVDPHFDRMAAIWFLLFGVLLFLLAMFVQWALQATGTLPASVGWGVLIMCVVGVILMPVSGFWLGIIEAIIMLRISYQANGVSGITAV